MTRRELFDEPLTRDRIAELSPKLDRLHSWSGDGGRTTFYYADPKRLPIIQERWEAYCKKIKFENTEKYIYSYEISEEKYL